jgi:hypothetical protein
MNTYDPATRVKYVHIGWSGVTRLTSLPPVPPPPPRR